MNAPPPLELATAQNRIGEELGVSPWVAIDQVKVNVFGEVTHWRTPGHCDPEYAETTPYGGTLMHGFHVVGLLSHFFKSAGLWPIDACDPLNYGLDKVRILKPIIIGEGLRLRSRVHLMEVTPKGNGEYLLKVSHHVEVEGAAQPAVPPRSGVLKRGHMGLCGGTPDTKTPGVPWKCLQPIQGL